MRPRRTIVMRAIAIAIAIASLACGNGVQHAALSPALAQTKVAESAVASGEARLVLTPPESRVVVAARDVGSGLHHVAFERFRGELRLAPPGGGGAGWLRLELDTATLRAESGFTESLARSMLEVGKYPHATLLARVDAGRAADVRVVTGNVTVHGVEHGITFEAKVRRDGDAWRFHAVFDMSRGAFGLKADGAWDPLIRDDLRVTFDFRGTPREGEP